MITQAVEVARFGTGAFTKDTLETVIPQDYATVVVAVRKMVDDLALTVKVDRPQVGFLYMEVSDLTGESIYVRVQQRTIDITSVRVQVGWGGNQPYSTMLVSVIEVHLKATAPEVDVEEGGGG